MFNRKKDAVKPELPKEYIWRLIYGEEEHEFKCLVTETEVITFEDGVEHKHLKIMDPTCRVGVLQIDTKTKIFDDMVDFQLERFIPYIRLEDGNWHMSHTTEDDRMQEQIAIYKKQSKWETITGIVLILISAAEWIIRGEMVDLWMFMVIGIFFICSAIYRLARLKVEIEGLEEVRQERLAEEAARKALKEKAALEAPKAEE